MLFFCILIPVFCPALSSDTSSLSLPEPKDVKTAFSIVPSCADGEVLVVAHTKFTAESFKLFVAGCFTPEEAGDAFDVASDVEGGVWTCRSKVYFTMGQPNAPPIPQVADAYVTYACGKERLSVYCGFRIPCISRDIVKSHEISLCVSGSTKFLFSVDLLLACYPYDRESLLPNSKKWATITCEHMLRMRGGEGLRSVYWFNDKQLDVNLKWLLRRLSSCCKINKSPEVEKVVLCEMARNPQRLPIRTRRDKTAEEIAKKETGKNVD